MVSTSAASCRVSSTEELEASFYRGVMWNGGLALAQEDLRHNIGSGPKGGVRLQMKTVLHLVFRLAVPHKELRCKRGAAADGSAVRISRLAWFPLGGFADFSEISYVFIYCFSTVIRRVTGGYG